MRTWLIAACALLAGIGIGGALFIDARPRTPLSLTQCAESCWKVSDVAGLLASVQLRAAPGWTPQLLDQSERCVAVSHWKPESNFHRVYLPKHDLRNVMELTEEDIPFLKDCLALAAKHAREVQLANYRVVTNGPALQHLTYFHFHVIGR
jgi:Scavenger mRNA decapping enzyme C-term binding